MEMSYKKTQNVSVVQTKEFLNNNNNMKKEDNIKQNKNKNMLIFLHGASILTT